ncbi:MAG: hypothetical protein KDC85_18180 [Saprospiraceae bacterium]|nr:hypothetical protein [Saprospiraceae bacterium]MCB9325863.1 hypothetical protein [Lewinellaceae bacterium]
MNELMKFLGDNLTKSQFDNLPITLQVTPNFLTMALKDPGRFELNQIRKIAELTGTDAYKLVFDFKLGYSRFTGPDLDAIAREAGYTLGLIQEAA